MRNLWYSIAIIFMIVSCADKTIFDDVLHEDKNVAISVEQIEMLAKMKEASIIISQFADNREVNTELSKLIDMGIYKDDFIPFKDLFNPSENNVLKSANIIKTSFESAFDKTINNTELKSVNTEDLKTYLSDNNLVLYIPYPVDDYPENKQIPAVSYHPLTNNSINEGYLPKVEGEHVEEYNVVQVDEEYSLNRPVYLIIPKDEFQLEIIQDMSPTYPSNSPTSYPVNASDKYIAIELENFFSRDKVQYDNIFNGGSEFRMVRLGVNKINNHRYGLDDDWIDCYLTRREIRNKTVKISGAALITEWTAELEKIVVAVYEYDRGEWKIDGGSIGVKFKMHNEGDVYVDWKIDESIRLKDTLSVVTGLDLGLSFKFEIQSEDPMLGKQSWGRNWIATWPNGKKEYSFGSLGCNFKAISYN